MAEENPTYSRTTLETMAEGAIAERFKLALMEVLSNIDDPNTEARKTRKIVIEIALTPDGSRRSCEVFAQVKTKLAPSIAAESVIFVVRDRTGEVFAVNNNVHQPELFKS